MEKHSKAFVVALRQIIEDRGHGEQARLAKDLKKSPVYINGIVRETRNPGIKIQTEIAAYYGMTLAEILGYGERLMLGENNAFPYPIHAAKFEAHSMERAEFIISKAAEKNGLAGASYYSSMGAAYRPEYLTTYLDGRGTDQDLWDAANTEMRRTVEMILAHKRR